ncbi:MAG TPA: transglutaminase family protein [Sporichthyaceae bacterium]|jgi:transglutaminase-like putative cysteine protease|nr:transglutaminase family protein [Sporichthyaceae bacterium]
MSERVYEVTHRTVYNYEDEVTASYGRAHLTPRHGEGQRRVAAEITVDPAAAELRDHTDFFGNRSTYFAVTAVHTRLEITSRSTVAVSRAPVDPHELSDLTCDQIRELLDGTTDPDLIEAATFRLPSPRVVPNPAVREFAAVLLAPHRPVGVVLLDLLERIHDDFAYVSGSTSVSTTTAEFLARREGVCQDFAHLAVAVLRTAGVPARYVSGYLETRPPPGRPRLQGADASHAWASAHVPGHGWVDLDPTNRKLVDDSYVVVAVGRDYGDVPPLRGVIFTESSGSTLDVSVDVVPVS